VEVAVLQAKTRAAAPNATTLIQKFAVPVRIARAIKAKIACLAVVALLAKFSVAPLTAMTLTLKFAALMVVVHALRVTIVFLAAVVQAKNKLVEVANATTRQ
jgi:hypothetical protein